MKRNIIKFLLLAVFVGFISSCTKDFEEINTDISRTADAPTSFILTNAQFQTAEQLRDNWLNGRMGLLYSQYWSQINYTEESRFAPRGSTTNLSWSGLYRVLYDLQDIINKNSGEGKKVFSVYGDNENQIAVAKIMQSYIYHVMTDIWGDIPYTEALTVVNITPKYDDAKTVIYPGLIKELQDAIALINEDPEFKLEGDAIYGGDVTKWKKFAHSLICRIAFRMGDVTLTNAHLASAFSSNSDNAQFTYSESGDSKNPVYVDFIEDGRIGKDFAVCKTLIDYMNIDADPRRPFYAKPLADGSFAGLTYGLNNANGPSEYKLKRSIPSENIYASDATVSFMNYDEVLFIKAEITNSAADLQAAIEASCTNWGASATDATTYALASIATNGVSQKSIVTEKWVALYMQGMQGWSEYRRTGYPDFLTSPADGLYQGINIGSLIVPARLPYPSDESQLNEVNYSAALAKLNDPRMQSAKMFWAK